MPTLSPQVTPYYGGGQVVDPANVIQVTGAPSSAAISNGLGTIAVDNTNINAYMLMSKAGNVANWQLLGGTSAGTFSGLTGDNSGTATPNPAIIVAGTANQITTSGASHTLTLSLPSAITAPGSLTTTTTLASGTTLTAGSSMSATTSITAGTTLTATLGNITATNGNLNLAHTGNKLLIHASTSASDAIGTATLVAGSVVVSTTAVTSSSIIFLTRNTAGGSLGNLTYGSIVNGTSFTITSSSGSDTSTVNYLIIN